MYIDQDYTLSNMFTHEKSFDSSCWIVSLRCVANEIEERY